MASVEEERPIRMFSNSPSEMLGTWLTDVEKYLQTPDLWSELLQDPGVEDLIDKPDNNSQFDASEQAEIATWAAELKQSAAEQYALDGKQMKALEEKLDYLVDASSRLGRVDWLNASVGAVVGIVMNEVIASSVAQQILQGLVASVGHLFGHPVPLIGPGAL